MTFLPDSPFTIVYALILGAAILVCLAVGPRSIRMIAAIMALNWIGTRAVTAWGGDLTPIFVTVVDVASVILLLVFVHTVIGRAIAALFGLMLMTYAAHDFGLLEREQMWAAADLFAYIQILLMVGGSLGKLRRVVRPDHHRRFSHIRGALSVRSTDEGFTEIDPDFDR